jgi:hypothetical protein
MMTMPVPPAGGVERSPGCSAVMLTDRRTPAPQSLVQWDIAAEVGVEFVETLDIEWMHAAGPRTVGVMQSLMVTVFDGSATMPVGMNSVLIHASSTASASDLSDDPVETRARGTSDDRREPNHGNARHHCAFDSRPPLAPCAIQGATLGNQLALSTVDLPSGRILQDR